MAQCEVCGHDIVGNQYEVMIDKAKMIVCWRCSKLGSPYRERIPPRSSQKRSVSPRQNIPQRPIQKLRPRVNIPAPEETELISDFNLRVRKTRENLNLTLEDFGEMIGEKVSVLRKVENGKIYPNYNLARKLEHSLKIKILTRISEIKLPSSTKPLTLAPTLGDIIQVKKKEIEEKEE